MLLHYQSGRLDVNSRHISKRDSAALRKVLFQITEFFILNKPQDEPAYQFIDKKRSEGKHITLTESLLQTNFCGYTMQK